MTDKQRSGGLEAALQKIGLSDKEAKVYLAGLQLGQAPIQNIAAAANVSRPSTYIAVEHLLRLGLFVSLTKGVKKVFQAAPPSQLVKIINTHRQELQEREKTLSELLTKLEEELAQAGASDDFVRIYEGDEAVRQAREFMDADASKSVVSSKGFFQDEKPSRRFGATALSDSFPKGVAIASDGGRAMIAVNRGGESKSVIISNESAAAALRELVSRHDRA